MKPNANVLPGHIALLSQMAVATAAGEPAHPHFPHSLDGQRIVVSKVAYRGFDMLSPGRLASLKRTTAVQPGSRLDQSSVEATRLAAVAAR